MFLGRRAEKWPGSSSIQPPAILKARWGDLSGWLNPTTCGPSSPRPSVMLGGVRPTLSAWTLVKGAKGRIRATSRPAMGALCFRRRAARSSTAFSTADLSWGACRIRISAIFRTWNLPELRLSGRCGGGDLNSQSTEHSSGYNFTVPVLLECRNYPPIPQASCLEKHCG